MFSWFDKKLLGQKNTEKYGGGVFARKNISEGTLLMVFGGYVMSRQDEDSLPAEIKDIAIQVEENLVLGIKKPNEKSETDFVNHSCEPNSVLRGQISLIAFRKIKKGEEITFDYGTVLYRAKNAPKYELSCCCGSKTCRGKITQNDWKNPTLQKKYKGCFSSFLQDKINKLKIKKNA